MNNPSHCPGCGSTPLYRVYPCRHGAIGIYCLDCNSSWYIRDVTEHSADEFLKAEMLFDEPVEEPWRASTLPTPEDNELGPYYG